MIDALTEPYVLFGLGTCLLMIVLVFVADYQESKTPPQTTQIDMPGSFQLPRQPKTRGPSRA